jgi:hypothetical protein
MPPEGMLAVQPNGPDCDFFIYQESETLCSSHPAPNPAIPQLLKPPPAETPPQGDSFPQSPTWILKKDLRFLRGYIYTANYQLSSLNMDRKRMSSIISPPNITPVFHNGQYVLKPIPGMVQMVPGIPFVYLLEGDQERLITVGCAQTLHSLKCYPDFDEIACASVHLAKLTWGCPKHGNTPELPRLCRLEGLKKKNNRSKGLEEMKNTGSYHLAGIRIQGNGQGIVAPAVQIDSGQGASQIATVLKTLNTLFRLVFPKCVSKMELDLINFHNELNNVFSFGGLDLNGTDCQFNCSSSLSGSLSSHLGGQGGWHTDSGDDVTRFTMFTLLLNVGPCKAVYK